MYADLTLPANTWHSWISEATSTGDHTAIISYEAAIKAWLADPHHREDCDHCPVYGRTGKTCSEAIEHGQCQVTGRYHYNNRSNQHGVLHAQGRVRNAAREHDDDLPVRQRGQADARKNRQFVPRDGSGSSGVRRPRQGGDEGREGRESSKFWKRYPRVPLSTRRDDPDGDFRDDSDSFRPHHEI